MRKSINLKDLAKCFCETLFQWKWKLRCGGILRIVCFLGIFFIFVVIEAGLFAQSPNAGPRHTEPRRILSLPSLTTPFQSVLPLRASVKDSQTDSNVNNELPGFGTLQPKLASTNSFARQLFPSDTTSNIAVNQGLIPAIYIEGDGYVPVAHPNIQPYLNPAVIANPESDPAVVMIPENQLANQWTGFNSTVSTVSKPNRIINTSGSTVLSYPKNDSFEPIIVSAQSGWMKESGDYEIFFLTGDCSVRQGHNSAQGPHAVVWIARKKDTSDNNREVTVYLESSSTQSPLKIELDREKVDAKIFGQKWLGRFRTTTSVDMLIMNQKPAEVQEPAIYQRALDMMLPKPTVIDQVGYVATAATSSGNAIKQPPRYRLITVNPRGDNDLSFLMDPYPNNPDRGILVFPKGLNVIIEGITGEDMLLGDTVDISADSAVVWMDAPSKLMGGSPHKDDSGHDFELYLEGNISFRDAEQTIQANRMYYDAKNKVAYILDGRLETPIKNIKNISGTIRLRAEILRQLGDGLFTAKNSVITTSQLGKPSYALRSRTLTLNQNVPASSLLRSEPQTKRVLIAENNFIVLGDFPVFYWPWFAADLDDPTLYIKNIAYGNSSMYGHQIRTLWDPFQILNIRNKPDWLDGDVNITWLEERGMAYGTSLQYSPSGCFGISGETQGSFRFWGINDAGLDRLGGGRNNVTFPHDYRYYFHWHHQQEIESLGKYKGPWHFSAQVGKVSDRNFINNYFNNSWNISENQTTSVGLKKLEGHSSFSLFSEYALDDCYSNANWLPRLDHFLVGQSLLRDRLTWYEHTRIGYMNFKTATAPYDWNNDGRYFSYLPWELTPDSLTNRPPNPLLLNPNYPQTVDMSAEVFSTRHEFDLPFNIGPVRIIPYALGDFSHWGKDRSGQDVQRFYGQGGVRLNIPFWKILPNCSSRTWYINGLAHKIDFDAELSYSRSDRDMDNLIMTDALDTWSIEDFRRRYSVTTFGGMNAAIPIIFDPRYYALRSGLGGEVTAGNMEIADDITLYRFGMTHRWQTKRGSMGRRHVIDWITLSAHFNYYPESEYNFGESIGLIDYNFLWHIGDRFSFFSSGLYDMFEDGQRITRIGGAWNRPNRGNLSIMLDQLDGLIERTYLTLSVGYTMNEKYSMSYTTSYDIKEEWQNVGHVFMFTRTGEALRIFIGATYSEAREDWSFTFGLEPVFMHGIAAKMQQMSNNVQQMNSR
ncbi:MAG: hypothetical protein LBP87_04285 [Planctomycetaceae bacterium]|nr:hypothetical protein [Planctomycetaceae bacterium]